MIQPRLVTNARELDYRGHILGGPEDDCQKRIWYATVHRANEIEWALGVSGEELVLHQEGLRSVSLMQISDNELEPQPIACQCAHCVEYICSREDLLLSIE